MADFRNIPKNTEPDWYWHTGNVGELIRTIPDEIFIEPFRLAPHVWMVSGNPDSGSYLIDTGSGGLILVDAPYHCGFGLQKKAIEMAGFDVKDIKNIFVSHPHFDHYGAVKEFWELTGADIWMTRKGHEWMERRRSEGLLRPSDGGFEYDDFKITKFYDDNNPVKIGDLTFNFESHDGHSPGAVVMFFDDTDPETGKTYRVGMHGGIGTCNSKWVIKEGAELWHYYRFIADCLEMADKYTVDITLPNHENQTNMHTGINLQNRRDYSEFVNRDVWRNLMIQKAEISIKEG